MKAVDKDPERRYDRAKGFAADIHLYLDGEPVVAWSPFGGYRFRKFARRNKAAMATQPVSASSAARKTAGRRRAGRSGTVSFCPVPVGPTDVVRRTSLNSSGDVTESSWKPDLRAPGRFDMSAHSWS